MNFPDRSDSGTPEFGYFVSALKEIFHDESWQDVRRSAQRAWWACGFADDTPWTEVEEHVHEAWGK
jgi:hypothetical protein